MPRCGVCKSKYVAQYNTLQPTCNNFECMAAHATKTREKAQKAEKKQRKANDKAFKQKVVIEDLGYQHGLTKPVFNRMRVLEEFKWFSDRDIEPYCISCQKTNMDWCCGHFKTVGSQGNLRYDRLNTYLQCNRYCNMGLSGNIEGNKTTVGYKKGLLLRFGEDEGQWIIDYCEIHTEKADWYWEDLKNFRAEYSARIRELEVR